MTDLMMIGVVSGFFMFSFAIIQGIAGIKEQS